MTPVIFHVTELNIPSNLLSKYKDRVASLKIKEKISWYDRYLKCSL